MYICSQNTNLTVSNTFNIKSVLTACARNHKAVSFCKKSKINEMQLRKTLLSQVKKDSQYQEL